MDIFLMQLILRSRFFGINPATYPCIFKVLKEIADGEELKLKMQREIQDLQLKLHHAGQTLAAVRQQASNDFNGSAMLTTGFQPPNTEHTVNMVTMPAMKPMASLFASHAGTMI